MTRWHDTLPSSTSCQGMSFHLVEAGTAGSAMTWSTDNVEGPLLPLPSPGPLASAGAGTGAMVLDATPTPPAAQPVELILQLMPPYGVRLTLIREQCRFAAHLSVSFLPAAKAARAYSSPSIALNVHSCHALVLRLLLIMKAEEETKAVAGAADTALASSDDEIGIPDRRPALCCGSDHDEFQPCKFVLADGKEALIEWLCREPHKLHVVCFSLDGCSTCHRLQPEFQSAYRDADCVAVLCRVCTSVVCCSRLCYVILPWVASLPCCPRLVLAVLTSERVSQSWAKDSCTCCWRVPKSAQRKATGQSKRRVSLTSGRRTSQCCISTATAACWYLRTASANRSLLSSYNSTLTPSRGASSFRGARIESVCKKGSPSNTMCVLFVLLCRHPDRIVVNGHATAQMQRLK